MHSITSAVVGVATTLVGRVLLLLTNAMPKAILSTTTVTTTNHTTMQKFTIETPDGLGEAIKTERNVPWDVTLPTTEFRFYGSVPEVKAEIKRRLKVQYPTTNR